MNLEHYEYDQLDESSYRFFSTGRNGTFELRVRITQMGYGSYNLGFGVYDWRIDELDDLVEVRNGDSQRILATVADITLRFLRDHPKARIYASGSTEARTRLYQKGINRILPTLEGYVIAGYLVNKSLSEEDFPQLSGQWRSVVLGMRYEAFLIYQV